MVGVLLAEGVLPRFGGGDTRTGGIVGGELIAAGGRPFEGAPTTRGVLGPEGPPLGQELLDVGG